MSLEITRPGLVVSIKCNGCQRWHEMTPEAFSELTGKASADQIRRRLRCSVCGHRGAYFHTAWHVPVSRDPGHS